MMLDSWLEAHPYLRPVAKLSAEVEGAVAALEILEPPVPDWDAYRADFLAGVTLLHSADAAIDPEPGGRMAAALIERLALAGSSGSFAAEIRALHSELQREPCAGRRIVDLLLGDDSVVPAFTGLTRYLGWNAMKRFIAPVVLAFDNWRNEEHWQRRYCPTCGSLPAMAQLAGEEPARRRLLACGCCGTRWHFKRTCCPFCETDAQRLETLVVAEESVLRIDYCASCRGYIKTYDGQGNENLFLSDWSSLHLDLLGSDRGLKRLATSLYELY
jgi:FdhE protein